MNSTKTVFVTGISTDVGKTIASAILVQALQADYWKPIQSGELEYSDSHKLKEIVDFNPKIHPNTYALKSLLSPHASARIDSVHIELENIIPPKTDNHLVIEGAGGLLVPLNNRHTILDMIKPHYKTIVVSRHYLGSINHTLLTIDKLQSTNLPVSGIIFNGKENPETENIISTYTKVPIIGRIDEESSFDKQIILKYTNQFKTAIKTL